MESKTLYVSPAPHVKRGRTINSIMVDMIIALIPAVIAAVYFYEMDAVKILLASTISAVASEMLWNKFVKKTNWLTDFSPIATGLMVGLIMPNHVPVWVVCIGAIFAIIVVKMFFGGLGQNFMNPAAASKAFLITTWAAIMAKPVVGDAASGASGAWEVAEKTVPLFDQLLGQATGNIGEASILAILLGGLYLAVRKVINLRAPLAFIACSFAMYAIFDVSGLIPAGFFFVAIFMTTDYATTPMTRVGQYIFGAACGILAAFIAVKGFNAEAPYYALIILNLFTPMIEHFTTKKVKVKEVA